MDRTIVSLATGPPRIKDPRKISLLVLTAICLSLTVIMALTVWISVLMFGSGQAGSGDRDFVAYWTAGKQLVRGENPYVPDDLRGEISREAKVSQLQTMINPPLMFWLVVPLGLFNLKGAALVWLSLLLASFSISLVLLWDLNRRRDGEIFLFGLCFMPALYCLLSGQIGLFLLLGISLFLRFHESHEFLAGAALVMCMVKPHLFLVFGVVLAFWILEHRRYRIVAGFGVGLISSLAIAYLLDRHAWSQWREFIHGTQILDWPVPTLSHWLFKFLERQVAWLQFLPASCGCLWALWYFRTHRNRWKWTDQGLFLLILSVGCSPYSWITDQALLLPALMISGYRAQQLGRAMLPLVLIFAVELLELLSGVGMKTNGYLWTIPAYLAWCWYATKGSNEDLAVG